MVTIVVYIDNIDINGKSSLSLTAGFASGTDIDIDKAGDSISCFSSKRRDFPTRSIETTSCTESWAVKGADIVSTIILLLGYLSKFGK